MNAIPEQRPQAVPFNSAFCPVCEKPVRIVTQPGQPHQHIANHGPKVWVLCAGSGKAVPEGAK